MRRVGRAAGFLAHTLLSIVCGALIVLVLLFNRELLPPIPAPALPGPTPTVTEKIMATGGEWCGAGCLGLAEFAEMTPEKAIIDALSLAYDRYPEWRPLAKMAVARRTRVVVGDLQVPAAYADITGATYVYQARIITVRPSLLAAEQSVLAAALAHEVYHAATDPDTLFSRAQGLRHFTSYGVYDCFAAEINGYAWQSVLWARVRRGDEQPSTWVRLLDEALEAYRTNRLREAVLGGAADFCLRARLPAY